MACLPNHVTCHASVVCLLKPKMISLSGAGDYPSIKDWETHLTTIFPEIRLKRYLEMRGADGGPWANICALPALWVRPQALHRVVW
jgi:gamma-glutamylcysteine synthetase